MSIETTPSKKVRYDAAVATTRATLTNSCIQAVSAMESLKMESPVKMQKLVTEENKENLEAAYEADEVAVPIKGIPDLPEPEQEAAEPTVASSIKPEEKEEPILQENPQRFVLFPIKYHEVSALKTTRDSTR
jgi:hypothetical protein